MRAARDYNLVVDGKYNRRAIMKKAWAYYKNPFCTQYRNDFKGAVKAAWVDAHLEMDEYKAQLNLVRSSAPVRNLRACLYRPGYENYDSSWR